MPRTKASRARKRPANSDAGDGDGGGGDGSTAVRWAGRSLRKHRGNTFYGAFVRRGERFAVGDRVRLVVPGESTRGSGGTGKKARGKKKNKKRKKRVLWIAQIDKLWEDQYQERWAACRWFYRPEDTAGGRQPQQSLFELYESDHVDENTIDSIAEHVEVLSEKAYQDWARAHDKQDPDDSDCDLVFFAKAFYNTKARMFRPLFAGSTGSGAKAAATTEIAEASESSDDDGGEDDVVSLQSMDADTGLMGARKNSGDGVATASGDAFKTAAQQLQLSAVPDKMPCRTSERAEVSNFLESAIRKGGLGCALYISGMPGTGKTATVMEVLREMRKNRESLGLPPYVTVKINAMKLSSPYQAYSVLYKALSNKHEVPARAAQLLDRRFSTPQSRRQCVLLVLDELDYLVTRKQQLLYNFFDWPTRRHSRLIVVGIANTMDLPERLLPKVHSRLGLGRIVFAPYTREQIETIVHSRLARHPGVFDTDAIEMASRKVASISGDVRRALQICRRAAEMAIDSSRSGAPTKPISIELINAAAEELTASHHLTAIAKGPPLERAFMAAVALQLQATGTDQAAFESVFVRFDGICRTRFGGRESRAQALAICNRLGDIRLLLVELAKSDRLPTVRLNVQQDDVQFALRNDLKLSSLW